MKDFSQLNLTTNRIKLVPISMKYAKDIKISESGNLLDEIEYRFYKNTSQNNKLIVISGCSGGGKSTLLNELSSNGYTVMREVGRELIKEQLAFVISSIN